MGAPGRLIQQAASGVPEYRIAGATAHLDLKHQEAREFKLAVLREVAEKGVDAVTVDSTLYPPHFRDRDPAIGRQLIRDVRAMLDEVGEQQNREIEPIVELPHCGALELGVEWRTWMREGLLDIIVPTGLRSGREFSLRRRAGLVCDASRRWVNGEQAPGWC